MTNKSKQIYIGSLDNLILFDANEFKFLQDFNNESGIISLMINYKNDKLILNGSNGIRIFSKLSHSFSSVGHFKSNQYFNLIHTKDDKCFITNDQPDCCYTYACGKTKF